MARNGYTVAEEAYEALGDGPCCGQCVEFAQEVMDEERVSPCAGGGAAAGVVGDFDAGLAADMGEGAKNRPAEEIPTVPLLNDVTA